jgi:hypothetical protein
MKGRMFRVDDLVHSTIAILQGGNGQGPSGGRI